MKQANIQMEVSEERLGKHVPAEKNTHATTEHCFRCGPRRGFTLKTIKLTSSNPCGGGSNTSTVALRVAGDDEKGTLSLGDINTGVGQPGWGSLESKTVKWGRESRGTRTRE
jgi:hypothetical protein